MEAPPSQNSFPVKTILEAMGIDVGLTLSTHLH